MSYVLVFVNGIVVALLAMYVYQNERRTGEVSAKHDETDTNWSKIGFLVTSSKHLQNMKADTVVVYDEVITNNGNGYDVKTGEFIAPADGLYFFTWTSLTKNHKLFASYLEMNGKLIAQNHACARDVKDQISATQSVVLQMKKNHIVLIKVYKYIDGGFLYADRWSTFSGFKI